SLQHKFIIVVLLCLYLPASVPLFAQNTDSLERKLSEKLPEQQQLGIYISLIERLATQNSTRAIQLGKEAMTIATRLNDPVKLGHVYSITGEAHYFKGNYDTASKYFY